MKLQSKILIFLISFAVITMSLMVFSIHHITYTKFQPIITENLKSPQQEKIVEEIFGTFTHEMIKNFLPFALMILLFISMTVMAFFFFCIGRMIATINDYVVMTLNRRQAEEDSGSEMLPNYLIELLKAAYQLSQLDLTIDIPTHKEKTAQLAKNLNDMAKEISQRLLNIQMIAENIATVSDDTKTKNENIATLVKSQQEVVKILDLEEIPAMIEAMTQIVEVVQATHQMAEQMLFSTDTILKTVNPIDQKIDEILVALQKTETQLTHWNVLIQSIRQEVIIIDLTTEQIYQLIFKQLGPNHSTKPDFVSENLLHLFELGLYQKSQISALLKHIEGDIKGEFEPLMAIAQKNRPQIKPISQSIERIHQQIIKHQKIIANLHSQLARLTNDSLQMIQIISEWQRQICATQKNPQTLVQIELQIKQIDKLIHYANEVIKLFESYRLPI